LEFPPLGSLPPPALPPAAPFPFHAIPSTCPSVAALVRRYLIIPLAPATTCSLPFPPAVLLAAAGAAATGAPLVLSPYAVLGRVPGPLALPPPAFALCTLLAVLGLAAAAPPLLSAPL